MTISNEAKLVLASLAAKHNVMLSGPPSCGKTHLIQEVADAFSNPAVQQTQLAAPIALAQRVAIPAQAAAPAQQLIGFPSPNRLARHVERIAFSARAFFDQSGSYPQELK